MKKDNKDLSDGPKKHRNNENKAPINEDKKRSFDNDDLSHKVKFIPNNNEFQPKTFESGKKNHLNKSNKSYDKPYSSSKPYAPKRNNSADDKPYNKTNSKSPERNSFSKSNENRNSNFVNNENRFKPKESFKLDKENESKPNKKSFKLNYDPQVPLKKQSYQSRIFKETKQQDKKQEKSLEIDNRLRLNKYIAQSGICSRREADEFIKKGLVTVNNEVIKEMGYKVNLNDQIKFEGKIILSEPFVYILMNKPKDFITTTEDDKGRKTVIDLLAGKVSERVFPVGRLDRNTTGVLLITNDGELTQILTHPSYQIKKVYHATLDKKVSQSDLDKLVEGFDLEDGFVHADAVAYVESEDKRHVGIEIHSGKNHIVKRMFEHLGYDVERLDRVSFGTFTKKDLPRGKWRFLTNYELASIMKMKDKASK